MEAAVRDGDGVSKGRVIHNPMIGDTVEFLKSSEETGGKYEWVEVTLVPGGGNPMHYHLEYEEEFETVSGVLSIDCDGRSIRLQPGEKATASIGSHHRFYNDSGLPVIFRVKITPACGFEHMLRITYGLACDGRIDAKGMPRNWLELAVVMRKGGIYPTGVPMAVIRLLFGSLYRVALWIGVERRLMKRYCRI